MTTLVAGIDNLEYYYWILFWIIGFIWFMIKTRGTKRKTIKKVLRRGANKIKRGNTK